MKDIEYTIWSDFTEEENRLIQKCAEEIMAVENGTASNQQIHNFMLRNVMLNEHLDAESSELVGTEKLREDYVGDYKQLLKMFKKHYPFLAEEYLPFVAADYLKTGYGTGGFLYE